MSSVGYSSVYENALLSDAAYVHLVDGIHYDSFNNGEILVNGKDDFMKRGFTEEQFAEFSSNYLIVDHMPNEGIGLSVTLFENRQTGERTLAFRGTEDASVDDFIPDIIKDLFLALGLDEITNGLGQSPRIEAFLQDNGLLDEFGNVAPEYAGKVNITGHSLGGHLTLMTAYDYPALVNQVYTYNGAGLALLDSFYNNHLLPFISDQAAAGVEYIDGRTTNVYAEPGYEVTRNGVWFNYIGRDLPLFIEHQESNFAIGNHSMRYLVDALSVGRVLSHLAPELSVGAIDQLLWQAADREIELTNLDGTPDLSEPGEAAVSLNTVMTHLSIWEGLYKHDQVINYSTLPFTGYTNTSVVNQGVMA